MQESQSVGRSSLVKQCAVAAVAASAGTGIWLVVPLMINDYRQTDTPADYVPFWLLTALAAMALGAVEPRGAWRWGVILVASACFTAVIAGDLRRGTDLVGPVAYFSGAIVATTTILVCALLSQYAGSLRLKRQTKSRPPVGEEHATRNQTV